MLGVGFGPRLLRRVRRHGVVVRGQRRVGGDKSGFAPHDFDEPKSVDGADGFGMCSVDRFDGARNGGFETE